MTGIVNHKVCLTLTILMVLGLTTKQAWAKYGGGSGSPEDPYLIYTAAQMNAIGADSGDWDKHFKLMADIDLSEFTGSSFNIIGIGWGTPFTGVFDGNGHKISNFTYLAASKQFIGIFGYVVGENALIKNLVLISPEVNAVLSYRVGSLAGEIENGTVTNCRVEQGTVTGLQAVGGLVGICWRGTIANCHSITTVSGIGGDPNSEFMVGGLVGLNYEGTITDCSSAGSVSGNLNVGGLVGSLSGGEVLNCRSQANVIGVDCVGGLVGFNDVAYEIEPIIINPSLISRCTASGNVSGNELVGGLVGLNWCAIDNCYATGNVSGTYDVGGLVGDNISAGIDGIQTDAVISNCYSVGPVSGTNYVGGLVGRHRAAGPKEPITINSFWDIQTSGWTYSAGGTGKTTAQMKIKSTFTSAGWDFTAPVWVIDEYEDYPHLRWEVNILYVPESCPTIQGAIDTAINGDTVIVAPGTYYENITLKEGVQVRGAGADVTTIDGGRAGSVVTAIGVGPDTVLDGFTITNGGGSSGGGIYLDGGSPVITNNVVTQNRLGYSGCSGGGIYAYFSSATITHNTISNNSAEDGGGIYVTNWPSSSGPMPDIEYNNIYGNNAFAGGGIYLQISSPTVRGNTIAANTADAGGGIAANHSSSLIANNIIVSNSAGKYGGGGIWATNNSSPVIVSNTVVDNTASGTGTGIAVDNQFSLNITNCIVWGNGLYNCTATYSDIQGGYPGEGNINADPRFVNAAGGNLHLLPDSPCINAGDPDFIPELNQTDIDGEPRLMLGRVDMGADEFDNELLVPAEYGTIQAAIDASVNGNTVIVAPGTYTGTGNRDIDFKGKAITVRSTDPNDPNIVAATTIDCQGSETDYHIGFNFHNNESEDSILSGFTITNGYSSDDGGGIMCSSSPQIKNCKIVANWAKIFGGGICCWDSSPKIFNCIVGENSAGWDYHDYAGGGGGGILCYRGNPVIANCIVKNNIAGSSGGIHCVYGNPKIENCLVENNISKWNYAGIYCYSSESVIIKNCIITGNQSINSLGGGIACGGTGNNTTIISNCLINNNKASSGSGIHCFENSVPIIMNCTITNNSSAGIYCRENSNPIIKNCILWENKGGQIYNMSSGTTVRFSDVQGGWAGTANINADPCFVNAAAGDLHLLPDSPCINAGDPAFVAGPDETDLDGELRVMLGRVDMGADEFNPFEIDFTVVNKRRIGRTLFEYDCEVTLTNISRLAVRNVQLEIVKASENMVVIDPTVTYGDIEIGPGESATSINMCTFRVDRSQSTDPAEIIWKSTFEMADGSPGVQNTALGISYLNLGVAGDITGDDKVNFEGPEGAG